MAPKHPKDIVDCFDNIKATEIQKQKMLTTVLASKKGDITMNRKARFSAVASLAAALILGTTTVLATTFGWHEALLSHFNATPEQIEMLDETVGAPNVSATQNGLTITVVQTIADSFGVYVLYDVTAEDESFAFPDETWIWARLFTANDSDAGVTAGSGRAVILENHGNRLLVLQHFHSTAPTTGGSVELFISELQYMSDERSYDGRILETLFAGEWSLRWELDFADTGKTLLPNTEIIASGATATVTKIVISPLSAMIFFEGDSFLPNPVSIRKSDGTAITFGADSENALFTRVASESYAGTEHDGTEESFSQTLLYGFDGIINVNDIESITIGNVTIPMGYSSF
ncbi:MAG: DUF4179 domain-containing protein [Defluviitaleaceae bacterium]|nr:DUF4179 domain-containing protein [Defluviitaleaceae bacterium]